MTHKSMNPADGPNLEHDTPNAIDPSDRALNLMTVFLQSLSLFDGDGALEPAGSGDCDSLVTDNRGAKWHLRVTQLASSDTTEPRPHGRPDLVQFHGWSYGVSEIRVLEEIPDVGAAENSYLVLILDATNCTHHWTFFFSDHRYAEALLIDVPAATYNPYDFEATRSYARQMGYGRSMKWIVAPGESRRVPLVFDVPEGDGPFVLSTQMIGEKISSAIVMNR